MKRILFAAALLLTAISLSAAEGKWTPQQVLELDAAWLKKQGLEIPPSHLWDPKRGTGLLAGTINVGGCSGGFISPDGLFITNHHCLFSMLQEHATPENDIIENGFVASSRSAELSSRTMRATIARSFTDVTKDILGAVPTGASDVDRTRAIERRSRALETECEKRPATRCRVAAFDGGVQYTLIDSLELQDIRLVYAPPRSVGEYGGEVDNWMWPRHTGDFAIGRAYVGPQGTSAAFDRANVPFRSEFFFPVSTKGVKPGDLVMVLGYPGTTYRALSSAEMAERRDFFFAPRRDVYRAWIHILETVPRGSAAGEIAVADELKTLWNRQKNAEGQIAGFTRGSLLEKQKSSDETVLKWASSRDQHRAAVAAYNGLSAMASEQVASSAHDFLLGHILATAVAPSPIGPKALIFATTVTRSAIERAKPDEQRDALYAARNIGRQKDRLERAQKSWYEPADKALLADWVTRALALPQDQRIAAVDRLFEGAATPDAVRTRIDEIYSRTRVFDLAERIKMFGESVDQLRARRDPLAELGFALDPELRDLTHRRERWDGVVAKHTGAEPFDVPDRILAAAQKKLYGAWLDAALGDVPVNFLSDADTTGGNSGSPTVNGRGELVGVNFDRVWENVANDFGYNPDIARNVNVDIRYMLWLLDKVENADPLLKELGVRK